MPTRRPTVLIADDDEDLLHLLAARCKGLGLTVECAGNAMTALTEINQSKPDVAILDVNMPAGNGLSVCEMMNANEELASIPVVVMTGNADHETVRRCHQMCAYYVEKCPDVWSRIEPLLRELVSIPDLEPDCEGRPEPILAQAGDLRSMDRDAADTVLKAIDVFQQTLRQRHCGSATSPPWVLCVEDDNDFSYGLKLRLEGHGVAVVRASAGMEAYRSAFVTSASAIILDYELPNGNGDYVLRRLKESPATASIPVIVLTGRRDRHLERTMYNLGADSYMTKPLDWNHLWAELSSFLPAANESRDPVEAADDAGRPQ